jgi:hypothetical protein
MDNGEIQFFSVETRRSLDVVGCQLASDAAAYDISKAIKPGIPICGGDLPMSIMNNFTVHWKSVLEEVADYPNGRLYAIAASPAIIILWQYWQNTVSR